jgi:membrane protease YdiL (CAAX protease family)
LPALTPILEPARRVSGGDTIRPRDRLLGVVAVLLLSAYLGLEFEQVRGALGFDATRPFSPAGLVGLLASTLPLLAAHWIVRRRGGSWSDYGLDGRMPVWKVLVFGLAAAILVHLVFRYALGPLAVSVATERPDISHLMGVAGNVSGYITVLAVVWVTAAFMEELLFRGFLLNETARALGGGRLAWVAAAVAIGVVFGLAHAYQGPSGMIITGGAGVLMGLLYLALGRSLWPLILAHGLIDSWSITRIFLAG